MTAPVQSALLREQLEYYRLRAAEYDEWWLRRGRYDHGNSHNALWFAEGVAVARALEDFQPAGRILELAGGTGIWTERLLPFASALTVVDGSSEMIALCRNRLRSPLVRYIQSDLFEWEPGQQFDTVFFAFWLSHVPPELFTQFWDLVRRSLRPGGKVFFVDSRYAPTSTAANHELPERSATVLRRKLNDGREFQIVKVFHDPADLDRRLRGLGWRFDVRQTDRYFLYGSGGRETS
jgi:SAM-dependent methyltransferase